MARGPKYDARDQLTPREREVLELLRQGLTDAEIAERLGISQKGASYHVSEIIGKLGVSNRREAAYWPERPPWWAGALAPMALLWRRVGVVLAAKATPAAALVSGGAFVAAMAGLGLIAVLMLRGGAGASLDGTRTAPDAAMGGSAERRLVAAPLSGPNTPEPTPPPDTPLPALSPPNTPSPTAASTEEGTPQTVHDQTATPPASTVDPTATVEPTPAPILVCQTLQPEHLAFVYFRSDVPRDRAREIVESVGGFIVPVEVLMGPVAYPTPQPGAGEYGELVEVEPMRLTEAMDRLRAFPEVTRVEFACG